MKKIDKILNNIYKKYISFINKLINKKTVLISLIIFTILALLPILLVSFYTHPAADDYNYGINTINVLKNSGLLGVLNGVIKTVVRSYKTWQGTFSAIAIFSLNPSVWGNRTYFLTTFIVVFSLFAAIYYLFKNVIYRNLKADKITLWICILAIFLLSIETLPDVTQGLFWWNGASYYMLFYCFELVEIALLVKMYFLNKKTKLNYSIVCFLAFFIGGGNFITALQQIILLFFLNIYLIIFKKDKTALPIMAFAILGLAISVIAPGNAKRAKKVVGMSAISSIITSFKVAFYKTIEWFTPLNFIIITLLVLLLIPTYKNIKFKFKYPVLVVILSFCVFAAEFTPTLYSTSTIGEGRLWNIMYISFLLILFSLFYYLFGYFRQKINDKKIFTKNALVNSIELIREYNIIIVIIFIVFVFNSLYNIRFVNASYGSYLCLIKNEAQVYDKEYRKRIKILEDDNIKEVKFKELTNYPYPIVYSEIGEDPKDWRNKPLKQIYNKKYVILIKK